MIVNIPKEKLKIFELVINKFANYRLKYFSFTNLYNEERKIHRIFSDLKDDVKIKILCTKISFQRKKRFNIRQIFDKNHDSINNTTMSMIFGALDRNTGIYIKCRFELLLFKDNIFLGKPNDLFIVKVTDMMSIVYINPSKRQIVERKCKHKRPNQKTQTENASISCNCEIVV